jgi:hypothetical protein
MGSGASKEDFSNFTDAICRATVTCQGLNVRYESPAVGLIQFGWTGPLLVGGREQPLAGYPRFDNAYCQGEIGDRAYTIQREDAQLTWELKSLQADKS